MTVSATANSIDFLGSGSVAPLTFPYTIHDAAELFVYTVDALGAETPRVGSLYFTATVAIGFLSATVVPTALLAAAANGLTLRIRRKIPYTQTLNLLNNTRLSEADIETALDRTAMRDQQILEVANNAVASAADANSYSEGVSLLRKIPVIMWGSIADYSSPTDHTPYLQAAIDEAEAKGGGIISVPPGRFNYTALDMRNRRSVIFRGLCGQDRDFAGNRGAILNCTSGAGTLRAIDVRGTECVGFEFISATYSHPAFDGHVIDFGRPLSEVITGNKCHVRYCSIYQIPILGVRTYTAKSGINLYRTVEVDVWANCISCVQDGVTGAPHSPVTVSLASPGIISWPNHNLSPDEAVTFELTGAAGITSRTIYYVKTVLDSGRFTIATNTVALGGVAVNTTTTGTGEGSTVAHIESISCVLRCNEFSLCANTGVSNPGIGWQIIDVNVFEPHLLFAPRGIRSYGGNILLNNLIEGNIFADGYLAGNYIEVGPSWGSDIIHNSFGSNSTVGNPVDITAIKTNGTVIGGNFGPNTYLFMKQAIIYGTTITGHTAEGSNLQTVWGVPYTGMYFGDITCSFAHNVPDQLATITVQPVGGKLDVFNPATQQLAHIDISKVGAGLQSDWVSVNSMVTRTTAGAVPGSVETTTQKIMLKTFDFDATTQQFVQFTRRMPKSWDEGAVYFVPVWSHAAAATFGVVWQMQAVAINDLDGIDATAFGAAQNSVDVGGTTNLNYIGPMSAAITIAGAPTPQELVVFQIARAPADASDTLNVPARLLGVTMYYTTDANTDL